MSAPPDIANEVRVAPEPAPELDDRSSPPACRPTGDHPLAHAFHRLSPERVLHAVEVGGRRCTGRFLVLNSLENRVYQLELETDDDDDARRGPMVVAKFYRPGRWSREAIVAEHTFLAELAAADVPVASPLPLRGEATVGEVEGILYAVFPRLGGRAPEEPTDAQLQMLGRLLARLHQVGSEAPAPARSHLTPETYGRRNLAWLLESGTLPVEARARFAATAEALLDRIEPMFRDVPVHRIHGDCHKGNLLWAPDGAATRPVFLDFDDFLTGPAVQDVWMLAPSADAEGRRQRRVLVEAYAELRDFDPAWLRLVEPLRALRFLHYSTWIARRIGLRTASGLQPSGDQKASGDPVFVRTFPHFGTLTYWQRETQDLCEQIARIDDARDRA